MIEKITLGGGCFWCLDAAYRMVRGVTSVVTGYAGGDTDNPSYASVSSGTTGHAEVVQISFDTDQVQLSDILDIFWTIHDPTSLNFQGHDIGTQYRSCIFYEDEDQLSVIRNSRDLAQTLCEDLIVTTIEPLDKFYPAEDYHQDYFTKNPDSGYCQVVINPKLAHLRETMTELLQPKLQPQTSSRHHK